MYENAEVSIFIGGDTRPSTPKLLEILAEGIKTQKGNVIDFGLTTTPQLQYYGNFIIILVYLYNNHIRTANSNPLNIDPETLRPEFWTRFCQYFDVCAKFLKWDKV